MTLHLKKLCVGVESVQDLRGRQAQRLARMNGDGGLFITTRNTPKRADEILDGGSLYWVIRKVIQVRQRITGIRNGYREDGKPVCIIDLDADLARTQPTGHRPFQGWRYLDRNLAPADLEAGSGFEEMPPEMMRELRDLGLL